MPYTDKVVKFNKCAYFILPLTGLNTRSFGEKAIKEVYISYNKEIVVKLDPEEPYQVIQNENFLSTRNSDGFVWVSYSLPVKFEKDFSAFLEGKYSHFSQDAYHLISNSIHVEIIDANEGETEDTELDKEFIKTYINKMHECGHPVIYKIKEDATEISLVPIFLGAIAPKSSTQRQSLRFSLENDLGIKIGEDLELYGKPVLENEVIQLSVESPLRMEREQFDRLGPNSQFKSSVKEQDADICIEFTNTKNITHKYYIDKTDSLNFKNIDHLGNYIRQMIRKKLMDTEIEYTAICELNPWNKKIKINKDYFHFLN